MQLEVLLGHGGTVEDGVLDQGLAKALIGLGTDDGREAVISFEVGTAWHRNAVSDANAAKFIYNNLGNTCAPKTPRIGVASIGSVDRLCRGGCPIFELII